MRRVAALALIAVSAWLIYHTCLPRLGADLSVMLERLSQAGAEPRFLLPAVGGFLGMTGGFIALFGGPGGASVAMIGGVVAAGFSFYAGQPLHVTGMRVWENDALVSLTLLFLAGAAAVMARD